MMKRLLLFSAVVLVLVSDAYAQQRNNAKQLEEIFTSIVETYRKSEHLSYTVQYRYTNEHTPSVALDSMQASVVMLDSTRYWCRVDSTETMVNNQFSVVLFKEDKLMYLSRAQANSLFQPLSQLQRFLEQNEGITYQQKVAGATKVVKLNFKDSSACKELTLTIDTLSGYLSKIVYVVPTEQLVDEAGRNTLQDPSQVYDAFARVEARFTNYSTQPVDVTRFDEKRYFYKAENQFLPTEQFKEYKIFVATPDL